MPIFNSKPVRLLLPAMLLLAAAAFLAFDLFRLASAERLWGYRPLCLYAFSWSGLVLLIAWNRMRRGKVFSWRRTGLATLSGLILALGFPGFLPFPWLLFIGFVPLLIVNRELETARTGGVKTRFFPYAYHTFFIWNAVATFWVTNTALAAGLFAVLANALLMCIPVLLFRYTNRYFPRFGYVSFIAYWIAFEYIHLQWDLSWPWLTLGNAFAQMYPTVQWYEYTGVFGGSLWILLMNVLLFKMWQHRKSGQRIPTGQWLRIAALFFLPLIFSLIRYFTYQPSEETRNVLVVQTNYEPHYEKFGGPHEREQIREIIGLIRSSIVDSTDFVLLPETVFGYARKDKLNEYPVVVQLREALSDYPGLTLITGLNAYHILQEGEVPTRASKERQDESGRTYYLETYNAAAQFIIGREEVPFYKKSKLVPGAESFPFPWLFFFMKPLVEQLGGTVGGFGSQKERTPLSGPKGRVAPVICYESIYGEYFGGYVRRGAQTAFIMTNDGWWDNTPGHRQHLYFASLRAVETRRSIARAANVGISALINERGDRIIQAHYDEAVTLTGSVSLNDKITFYVRWGDMIARIALFLSVLLLVRLLAGRLKAKLDR